MGRRGREMMLREFDERIVIERYLREISDATLTRQALVNPLRGK